ncbi:unnamed protein product [Protopolystoma xenopodis]|uniref:Uncharacterized protein n=1 Tax=Protopolystoma xenopodis TaxID=117903 RepID=A0A448WI16_9PLAT|nr:unnamed protein product [Protopolystoma xenopodis]
MTALFATDAYLGNVSAGFAGVTLASSALGQLADESTVGQSGVCGMGSRGGYAGVGGGTVGFNSDGCIRGMSSSGTDGLSRMRSPISCRPPRNSQSGRRTSGGGFASTLGALLQRPLDMGVSVYSRASTTGSVNDGTTGAGVTSSRVCGGSDLNAPSGSAATSGTAMTAPATVATLPSPVCLELINLASLVSEIDGQLHASLASLVCPSLSRGAIQAVGPTPQAVA